MVAGQRLRRAGRIAPLPGVCSVRLAAAVMAIATFATPILAQPRDAISVGRPDEVAAGRSIVARDCASCHAIDPRGPSPLPEAPPFRTLHLKYDVEDLAESLAEGIVAGHPAMPAKPYEPSDVDAVIAYLKSLGPAAEPDAEKPAP